MRVITLDSDKKVIGVKTVNNDYINKPGLQTGEIISDIGEYGQVKQSDGTFITPAPTTTTVEPTLDDKVNYLYYKSKGVIS